MQFIIASSRYLLSPIRTLTLFVSVGTIWIINASANQSRHSQERHYTSSIIKGK